MKTHISATEWADFEGLASKQMFRRPRTLVGGVKARASATEMADVWVWHLTNGHVCNQKGQFGRLAHETERFRGQTARFGGCRAAHPDVHALETSVTITETRGGRGGQGKMVFGNANSCYQKGGEGGPDPR